MTGHYITPRQLRYASYRAPTAARRGNHVKVEVQIVQLTINGLEQDDVLMLRVALLQFKAPESTFRQDLKERAAALLEVLDRLPF
jgi:hypothetical protein